MSRFVRPRRATATLLVAFVALGVAALPVTRAHAGLGGLMKAAKDKAANAMGKKATDAVVPEAAGSPGAAPTFDDVTLELTSERLDKIVAGLQVARDANAKRAGMLAHQQQMQDMISATYDKYGKAIDETRGKRDLVRNCWDDFLSKRRESREDEMRQSMMSDPAKRQKMMEMSQAMAKAQQSGNQAEVERIQGQMMQMFGLSHADSVAAQQRCGAIPPVHPMQVRIDSLQAGVQKADKDMRALDEKSSAAEAKASEMTIPQFAMARERIEMWLAKGTGPARRSGVTAGEMQALDAHRQALEDALSGR